MKKIDIIVDTREKRPWSFDPEGFTQTRRKLIAGDYSIDGLEWEVALERKSLGDFVGTVIGDWIRFRKELYRLAGFGIAAIVVEADVRDVLEKRYESDALPESVIARSHECFIDHGVPVFWWGDAARAERLAARFFKLAARRLC